MNFLKNWFYPAKDKPEKKKVCWLLLGKILNELLFLSEKETDQIADLDDTNPKVLQEIITIPVKIRKELKTALCII